LEPLPADLKSPIGVDDDPTDGASLVLDTSTTALGGHVHVAAVDASGQPVAASQYVNTYVE
jgi:hypothetical protein